MPHPAIFSEPKANSPHINMKWFKRICALFLSLLMIGSGWVWYEANNFLESPPASPGEDAQFDVLPGSSPLKIAKDLQAKGLVTDATKFYWLARLKNEAGNLQAGRFLLNTGWKPETILEQLAHGKPVLHRITIPEGLTWWQTAKLLEDGGFVRFDDFRQAISDKDFLRHYGIPFANAEGFLMPDTYLLKKPDLPIEADNGVEERDKIWKEQARSVAGRMIDNFWRKTENLWQKADASAMEEGKTSPHPKVTDLKKWVTLASIVEKETGIDHERPRVAGVYANRLALNMLLQADPTVAYGLGPDFKGPLLRKHLADSGNAYNTYQLPGLPPGPISSFGVAALKAAINPEKHSYLYFVAITDGGEHKFSQTLEQHNSAVQDYRQQKKKK